MDEQRLVELLRQVVAEELGKIFGARTSNAERQRRFRERKKAEKLLSVTNNVTRNESNVTIRKKRTAKLPEVSEESVAITIPTIGDVEYPISVDVAAEWERLYPAVDVPQTLREIRAWNLANRDKRKTIGGVMKHCNAWLAKEQNRG